LSRLRDYEDKESWQTFFDRYWRLLYNVARRAGLDDVDAQDVVQDTVIAVAKEIPEFRYDPERGSFKQWLFRILRRRVSDHFRKHYRQPAHAGISPEMLEGTGDADAIVMRDGVSLSDAWDQEWERSVWTPPSRRCALRRTRSTSRFSITACSRSGRSRKSHRPWG
jgi:RNA polymerase sigma-70 factor (ECF subfamily)